MKHHNFKTTKGYATHIAKKANILLDKCQIYGNAEERKGLMDNILMSIEAKSGLMEIFKNSPYHNGKGQLIIPMEIERPVDEDVVEDYSNYIRNLGRRYMLKEAEIDGYTYNQAETEQSQINRLIRAVDYMRLPDDEVIIKGKSFSEYREKYIELEEIIETFLYSDKFIYLGNGQYVDNNTHTQYDKVNVIANAIERCVGHLLEDEDDIEKLAEAFPRCQCREGVKISRVVQKCLKELGLYDLAMENEKETFNKRYAKWCDAVSPMKIKKWSVLSINFVDFLSMSHGDTWTSCLNTDKRRIFTGGMYGDGFNSKRTLDYALDSTTMVFYTINEGYDEDGDEFELQPKSTRQLFHFGEGKLVQARLYPQANTARRSIYDQYKANVEYLLAEAMGEANLWSAPIRGEIECNGDVVNIPYYYEGHGDFIDFLDIACHGDGESDFQDEVNYVIFRGSTNGNDNGYPMTVGSTQAVCIMCGRRFDEEDRDSISCC